MKILFLGRWYKVTVIQVLNDDHYAVTYVENGNQKLVTMDKREFQKHVSIGTME